jgi:3-deoxy-D-arabino-heptulosonate 7-phosphate (DAHP) synthase class II
MKAIGVDVGSPTFASTDFFVAHEALLLPYEEALARVDSTTGDTYACSGHMVGEQGSLTKKRRRRRRRRRRNKKIGKKR